MMKFRYGAAILAGAAVITAAAPLDRAATDTLPTLSHAEWEIDASHSTVGFSVRHFFTPVKGQFNDYEASLSFDPQNPESASVEVSIAVASVNTNNERRDNHLQSADFFEAETYPTITFKSTSVRDLGSGEFMLVGDLTIREVTKQVEMPVTLLGVQDIPENMQEMFGSQVASFQGELIIDRGDFNVGTGSWAENTIVGSEVTIDITIEAKHAAH